MDDDELVDEICQAIDRYMKRDRDLTIDDIFDAFDEIGGLLATEKIQLHRTH